MLTVTLRNRLLRVPIPDPVPRNLTPTERAATESGAERLAILVPSHRECGTAESAQLFEENILSLMRQTPSAASLHILFDTPYTPAKFANDPKALAAQLREVEKEEAAVGRIREQASRSPNLPRLIVSTYRDKPEHLKSKPGSLYLWLKKNREDYDYLIVADADTSFTPRTEAAGTDHDVVRRLLHAMLTVTPPPALIQTNIQQIDPQTITGWLEAEDGRSSPYYADLMASVYGNAAPCFGHNFICRTDVLWNHIRTDYLSHDMIEAASMAAHGLPCHFSPGTLTYEGCEEPLPAWLKRDARWGRGCAQWLIFMFRKKQLHWRPRLYLWIAIGLYHVQIAATLALVLGAFLLHQSGRSFLASPAHAILIIALITSTSLAPRLITGRPPHIALLATILRSIVSFGTIGWRTIAFLLSPYGKGWTPRSARGTPTAAAALASALLMLPGSAIGILAHRLLPATPQNLGEHFLQIAAMALIASPLFGAAVSIPFRKPQTATTPR